MPKKCLLCGVEKGKPRKVVHQTVENVYKFDVQDARKVLAEIHEACQRAEVLIKQLRSARGEIQAVCPEI